MNTLLDHINSFTKPTLFLIVGLPYSGKSYVSQFIFQNLNIERISFDEVWVKLSKENTHLNWEIVNSNNLEECKQTLSSHNHVVLDTYTQQNESRDIYKKFAEDNNATFSIIYIQRDIEKSRLRHMENKVSNERRSISDESLEHEIKQFVEPIIDENSIHLII